MLLCGGGRSVLGGGLLCGVKSVLTEIGLLCGVDGRSLVGGSVLATFGGGGGGGRGSGVVLGGSSGSFFFAGGGGGVSFGREFAGGGTGITGARFLGTGGAIEGGFAFSGNGLLRMGGGFVGGSGDRGAAFTGGSSRLSCSFKKFLMFGAFGGGGFPLTRFVGGAFISGFFDALPCEHLEDSVHTDTNDFAAEKDEATGESLSSDKAVDGVLAATSILTASILTKLFLASEFGDTGCVLRTGEIGCCSCSLSVELPVLVDGSEGRMLPRLDAGSEGRMLGGGGFGFRSDLSASIFNKGT